MEFWGIEIKPGKPLKVEQEDGYMIHVSQVTLGDFKKVEEDENVHIYVKNGDDKSKILIGTLSQKIPQFFLDLYFEQEFELSHNSESSVFLLGYKVLDVSDEQDEEIDSDSDVDEFMRQQFGSDILPPNGMMNGEMIKAEEDESGSGEEDESDSDEGSDEDEDEDESDGEEEEDEAPLKVEPPSKKRPNGEAMNNTVASKKAKVAIQNKSSGGKKKYPLPCGSSCKH